MRLNFLSSLPVPLLRLQVALNQSNHSARLRLTAPSPLRSLPSRYQPNWSSRLGGLNRWRNGHCGSSLPTRLGISVPQLGGAGGRAARSVARSWLDLHIECCGTRRLVHDPGNQRIQSHRSVDSRNSGLPRRGCRRRLNGYASRSARALPIRRAARPRGNAHSPANTSLATYVSEISELGSKPPVFQAQSAAAAAVENGTNETRLAHGRVVTTAGLFGSPKPEWLASLQ